MKSFVAPYAIDECKARLADLSSSSIFGFIKVKVKFMPNYRYILWKTMRGNFGQEITLAEVTGELKVRDDRTTVVSGISRMGRFYRILFILCGLMFIVALISFVTSQKVSYLFYAGLLVGFTGFGWLLTYYWRNQLEGMIEHTLLIQAEKKKSLPNGKL